MDHIFEPEEAKIKTLFNFSSPDSLNLFHLRTDNDMGGKSVAHFTHDAQCGAAVFHGYLDIVPPPGVDNSGYAAIVTKKHRGKEDIFFLDLEDYDALLLRVRCNHESDVQNRIFVVNMRAASVLEDDMFQAYLNLDGGKKKQKKSHGEEEDWMDVVLPFSDFVATHRGFVEGQQHMDTRAIESIGILMAQRKSGPFRLELKSISAINTDLYPYPGKRWTGVSRDSRDFD